MGPAARVASHEGALDSFDRIVVALQEAALEAGVWSRALALIDAACGLHGSHLFLLGNPAGEPPSYRCGQYLSHGFARDDVERRYAERYFALDDRVPRLLRMPAGCLLHNDDLLTEEERAASPVFAEYLRAWGGLDQLNVRLDVAEELQLFWTVTRDAANGHWRDYQLRLLQRLLPHVRHAARVAHALRKAQK